MTSGFAIWNGDVPHMAQSGADFRNLLGTVPHGGTGGRRNHSIVPALFGCFTASLEHTMGSKAVVLVVDDEPLLRMAGMAMVEDAGFEPIEASHADEAIEILESRDDVRLL